MQPFPMQTYKHATEVIHFIPDAEPLLSSTGCIVFTVFWAVWVISTFLVLWANHVRSYRE